MSVDNQQTFAIAFFLCLDSIFDLHFTHLNDDYILRLQREVIGHEAGSSHQKDTLWEFKFACEKLDQFRHHSLHGGGTCFSFEDRFIRSSNFHADGKILDHPGFAQQNTMS